MTDGGRGNPSAVTRVWEPRTRRLLLSVFGPLFSVLHVLGFFCTSFPIAPVGNQGAAVSLQPLIANHFLDMQCAAMSRPMPIILPADL